MSGGDRRRPLDRSDFRSTRPIEKPTDFSARIARNVRVAAQGTSRTSIRWCDAAGGSYYIENLTAVDRRARRGSSVLANRGEGRLHRRVTRPASFKEQRRSLGRQAKDLKPSPTRRETLLGTNQFPNFNEVAGDEITEEVVTGKSSCRCGCSSQAPEGVRTLKPYRGAMAFEQMRLKVDRSGKSPKAFMVTVRSARVRPGPGPVLVQLLRLRRHPRAGQHLFPQSIEEGIRTPPSRRKPTSS